jgi:hypothetical protein
MGDVKPVGYFMRDAGEGDLGRLAVFADDDKGIGQLAVGRLVARFALGPARREYFVCEPLDGGDDPSIHRFCRVEATFLGKVDVQAAAPEADGASAAPELPIPELGSPYPTTDTCGCPICIARRARVHQLEFSERVAAAVKSEQSAAPQKDLNEAADSGIEYLKALQSKTRAALFVALMTSLAGPGPGKESPERSKS